MYKAKIKNVQISPQKLGLVADVVRGKNAQDAVDMLTVLNKKGAKILLKALNSAIANAESLDGLKAEDLKIKTLKVDKAPIMRKYRFASRGRVSKILKRKSHIYIELQEV